MSIIGYKSLDKNYTNMYGTTYEFNKKYILNGKLEWRKNGFHFCYYPEDTLRYIEGFNKPFKIVRVLGSGDIIEHNDDYFGYNEMYASSEMTLLDELSRDELLKVIIESKNQLRAMRLIRSIKLDENEINEILKNYPYLNNDIDYYQYNKKDTYKKLYLSK